MVPISTWTLPNRGFKNANKNKKIWFLLQHGPYQRDALRTLGNKHIIFSWTSQVTRRQTKLKCLSTFGYTKV